MSDKDENCRQRAEYIEQCQRQMDEQQRQYLRQKRDFELEILRVSLQSQADISRMWGEVCRKARMTPLRRITVAM